MGLLTKIVKIGNSQGIRIPKTILDQVNLGDNVELLVEDDKLIIRPAQSPRIGWAEAFIQMAYVGDDDLIDEDWLIEPWDEKDWEW